MKKHFITGLLLLLPVAITVWLVVTIVNLLTDPFLDLVKPLLSHFYLEKKFFFFTGQQLVHITSQVLILLGLFLFTILLGMLTQTFLIHQFLKLGNQILSRIPLINKIYKISQDVVKPFLNPQMNSFKQVVMVPFPAKEMYCLGFLTEKSPELFSKHSDMALLSVFIPTSPNPMSGYLVMFKENDVINVEMTPEEAVKFIISCGVISPLPKEAMPVSAASLS